MTTPPALCGASPGDSLARGKASPLQVPAPLGQREGPQAPWDRLLDQFQSMIWKISVTYCKAVLVSPFRSRLVVYVLLFGQVRKYLKLPQKEIWEQTKVCTQRVENC